MQIPPDALGSRDPIPLLLLFAQRYRTGSVSPGRLPVRSRTVEDAVCAVGQAYARMGTPDPRLNRHGEIDFRLTSLYRVWQREDAPRPTRVKPLPLDVVAHVWTTAADEHTPLSLAAAQCLIVGFYFLLRPSEYLGAHSSSPSFGLAVMPSPP